MSDLSTYAGQANHYAAVKARLGVVQHVATVRRFPPTEKAVEAVSAPSQPVERDFLFVAVPADPDAVERSIFLPQWKQIVGEVARKHNVSVQEIVGGQRTDRIVQARHECCYRLSHETSMSLPQIGRRLGGRDHTTILHGIRRYARFLETGVWNTRPPMPKGVTVSEFWTAKKVEEAVRLRKAGITYNIISMAIGAASPEAVRSKLEKENRI